MIFKAARSGDEAEFTLRPYRKPNGNDRLKDDVQLKLLNSPYNLEALQSQVEVCSWNLNNS